MVVKGVTGQVPALENVPFFDRGIGVLKLRFYWDFWCFRGWFFVDNVW
jgi:hypothetical protein